MKNLLLVIIQIAIVCNVSAKSNGGCTPLVFVGGPTTFCAGDSVELTASEGASYLWTTGEVSQSIIVDNTGSYRVLVTDSNGCAGTSDPVVINVNENPQPLVSSNGPTSVCAGGNVNLTAIGSGPFVWNTMQIDSFITVSLPGDYWVTSADTNGCIGISIR